MKQRPILIALFLLFVAGAIFAGYNVFCIVTEYRAGENVYNEVQQYINLPAAQTHSVEENTEPEVTVQKDETAPPVTEVPVESAAPDEEFVAFPEVDFDSLLEINDDVVGWIYIEDTHINYPVVQGDDNRHYLSTTINGSHNGAGSIFMDYRNQSDLTDVHTILYGHHMRNKSMFADISNYRNQAYYDAHPSGMIITPEQNFQFEIVAGYVASLADSSWQLEFFSDEDALQWVQDAMARSGFSSKTVPELGDRFITLSTCSYEFNDARFVLVGVIK